MPASERIGEYLSVRPSKRQPESGKTARWDIVTNRGDLLGTVAWYGPWRQYTFDPVHGSTFNRACLLDIATYLGRVNDEHRSRRS